MNAPPTFYRDAPPNTVIRYLPASPSPERGPDGRPTLQLWMDDGGGQLQLGSQWTLSPDELAALRARAATRYPEIPPAALDVQPAQARVEEVALLLNEGGSWHALATSKSSGYVPFTALFSARLSREQSARVVEALGGRRDVLAVRYRGTVRDERGAWQPLDQQSDVATWFVGRNGLDHVRSLPGGRALPSTDDPPAGTAIHLDAQLRADANSLPIAFIALACDDQSVTLRPPSFDPVTIQPGDGDLSITTHYRTGPPPYRVTTALGRGEPLVLESADLGIAAVRLTVTPGQTPLREVRATVRYRPHGAGDEAEHTLYLRDAPWTARWWVVTRAATLEGAVEATVKVTRADGRLFIPPRLRQESTEIVVVVPD